MISDNVDNASSRTSGVVKTGEPVHQARTQMQQRQPGPPRNASPPVGGSCTHIFLQAKNGAYTRSVAEGRHDVKFGRARVSETDRRLHRRGSFEK